MKKAIIAAIIAFAVLGIIGSISKSIIETNHKPTIAEMVERANQDCPIPFAGGAGEVSSISLEGKNLVYHIKFFQENATMELLERDSDAAKELCFMSFLALNQQQGSGNKLVEILNENNLGCKIVFTDYSGKSHDVTLTPSYLAEMSKMKNLEPSTALYNGLSIKNVANGLTLPMKIDEGMVLVSSEIEGKNLVMTVEMDEPMYDINALRTNRSQVKSELLNAVRNPDAETAAMLDLCKVSHTGLVYRYVGKKSGQKVEISLSSQEIFNNHATPASIDLK